MFWNKMSVQDTLSFNYITEDGIIEIAKGMYSRSIQFNDINYQISRDEDRESIFLKYGALLNFFDPLLDVQITINNKNVSVDRDIFLGLKNDNYDKFRIEQNNIMKSHLIKGQNEMTKEKYITYTIRAADIRQARATFNRFDEEIISNFKRIGSSSFTLQGIDRSRILHDFFNTDKEDLFKNDLKTIDKRGISIKDIIAPDSFKFKLNYFKMGDKYARVLFLKDFPGYLNDRFIAELTDFNFNMMLTINIKSIEADRAIKLVKKQIIGMEANKIEYQKRASKSGYSQDILPAELHHSLKQAEELLDSLLNKNQKMFVVNVLMVHVADSIEELDRDTDMIMSTGRKYLCNMGKLNYQQEDSMISTIPIGLNKLKVQRTLTTDSTAVLMPFTSQELFHNGGIYYGLSSVSKNMIVFNRKSLKNPNGFVLGTPGAGKSFAAKKEMISVLLGTDDDVIVIDPENEYSRLVKNFDGEIIKMSVNTRHYINPLDMSQEYGDDDDPIIMKADFILSMCECLVGGKNGLTAKEKTLIDRSLRKVYARYMQNFNPDEIPTLLDFHRILEEQPEAEAKELALALEIYVKGSLSIFAQKTNVNCRNRLISYDIKDLGKQLKSIGMLVVLDSVWNRITSNRRIGRRTWIYVDEAHILFKNEYSGNFLHELFKRSRKWGGIPTALTQNVSEILVSDQAKTMLANSEFLLIFNQAASDRQELSKLLKISDTQMGYVTNSCSGSGLLFAGEFIIPFFDKYPSNSRLYRLMTTKPDEISLLKKERIG